MPRFQRDPLRKNYTLAQGGQEYNQRLLFRSQAIFNTLLTLLPSNYSSTVQGPNYTLELKAVAVELAKLELALEDVNDDREFSKTRPEFLYSIAGYLLLLNGRLPPLEFDDEQFRQFLLALVRIYFQGSIPESMVDASKLLISGDITVTENFLLIRQGASGYDISDQFGFQIDVNGFPADISQVDSSLRLILDLIRPAHTLFRLRYIFKDDFLPNDTVGKILDASRWVLSTYYYEDFRRYWRGVRNRDRLGVKTNQSVTDEDHSVFPFGLSPTISAVSPDEAILGATVPLTITGSHFLTGATVTINGVACTSVVVVNSTTITCVSPAIGSPGYFTLRVTNPDTKFGLYFPFVTYAMDVVAVQEQPLVSGGAYADTISITESITIRGPLVLSDSLAISDTVILVKGPLVISDSVTTSDQAQVEKL